MPGIFLYDLRIVVPPINQITCSVNPIANKCEELLRLCYGVYRTGVQPTGDLRWSQEEQKNSVRTGEATLPNLKVA